MCDTFCKLIVVVRSASIMAFIEEGAPLDPTSRSCWVNNCCLDLESENTNYSRDLIHTFAVTVSINHTPRPDLGMVLLGKKFIHLDPPPRVTCSYWPQNDPWPDVNHTRLASTRACKRINIPSLRSIDEVKEINYTICANQDLTWFAPPHWQACFGRCRKCPRVTEILTSRWCMISGHREEERGVSSLHIGLRVIKLE